MSYKPQGASLPTRYKKSVSQQSSMKQRPRDRLVVINSYNLADGSMLVTEDETNRKIEVRINPEKSSTSRGSVDRWNGNKIDDRMEKALPVGSIIALEGCETERKLQRNGQEVSLMRANWIASPSVSSPKKAFRGVITVNQMGDRIVGTQVWNKTPINPGKDEDAITSLGEQLDQILEEYRTGQRPVTMGVRFRTLVPTRRNDTDAYEMVDSTPPFDWIRAEKDAEGNILKEGHPLGHDDLENYLNGYLDYVFGAASPAPDAPQGLVAAGVIKDDADVIVEVMTYDAYQAAPLSDHMAIKNERHPLARLANVMTRYDQIEDATYVGKNWAVDGIVFLTNDQQPKSRDEDWKPRNLVSRVFTNGFQGHIDSLIPAADGKRVYVHPTLDRVRDNAPIGNAPAAGYPTAAGTSQPASVVADPIQLTPAADTADMFGADDDENGDYFLNATSSIPETSGEEKVAEVTPPAAKPAASQPAAAPATGAKRFARDRNNM